MYVLFIWYPDSRVHGANVGPIWGRQDPGGPHVGPMNFAIWVSFLKIQLTVANPLPLPLYNLFLQQNADLWAVITCICFVWLDMHSYGRIILVYTMGTCGMTPISASGDVVLPVHHTWLCHVMEMISSLLVIHYNDIIMGMMESQITSLTIVYSTVYSGLDQRKHQSSTSLAFVWGIHRSPVSSPHKGQ